MEGPKPYPNINVNFKKLNRDALFRLINHFDVKVDPSISDNDLAATVASVFDTKTSSEHEVVDKFAAKFCYSQANNSAGGDDNEMLTPSKKAKTAIEYHHFHPASVGEQVCSSVGPLSLF